MKKRLLCLLLAALMLLSMLTACSKPPAQEETPKDAPSESTDDPSAPASETSDEISPAPDLSGRTITLLTTDTWVQGIRCPAFFPASSRSKSARAARSSGRPLPAAATMTPSSRPV